MALRLSQVISFNTSTMEFVSNTSSPSGISGEGDADRLDMRAKRRWKSCILEWNYIFLQGDNFSRINVKNFNFLGIYQKWVIHGTNVKREWDQ